MNAAGVLIVVAGIGVILCICIAMARAKDRSRRNRDIDEPAEDNPYFGTDLACDSESSGKGKPSSRRCSDDQKPEADAFRFAPELFEHRTAVMEELETRGFSWMSHYSSVDCLHDQYGLEVCGIHEREDAVKILQILKRMFPDWKPG